MAQQSIIKQPPEDKYFDPKKVCERLFQLSMRSGYAIIQRNGQRYYGPPPNWVGGPPMKGSEVFIGRLPRDCFEDELVPVLESVAPIYEGRMMLNFTGYTRGFAFVTYGSPEDAWKAVMLLNNYEIRPGHKIGVSKSIDNCRLYIGGIPLYKTKAEAWKEVLNIYPAAKDVIMYSNPEDRKMNRGFLFIEFESHRNAAMAKRSMVPGSLKLWEQEVVVDWAAPEPDIDPSIMATITKLFIRNLTPTFTTGSIRQILQDTIPLNAIQRIYLAGHYGFVHFDSRAHAQMAMDKLSKVVLDVEMLEVHWARPKFCRKSILTNCRSLPPRFRRENYPTIQIHQEFSPLPRNILPVIEANKDPSTGVQPFAAVQFPVYNQPPMLYNPNPMSLYSH